MAGWLSELSEWFRGGGSEAIKLARRAEARGELARATELYLQAGAREQAARVLVARAESCPDPSERLALLCLARDHSGEARQRELERRCALMKLELCREQALFLTASELGALGRELSALEEHRLAAEAHALAGDLDAQAAALVDEGAIERLEAVFDADRKQHLAEQERERSLLTAVDLDRLGRRRAVLALVADQRERASPRLLDLEQRIRARRALGPVVALELAGQRLQVVLGTRVTLGRGGSGLSVPSPAISREHLVFERRAGHATVVDVSSNGSTLGGIPVTAPLRISGRLELTLGGEVEVCVEPDARFGVRLALLGRTYLVPLPALEFELGVVRMGSDRWIELEPAPAPVYLNGWRIVEPVELCRGDRLSASREGPVLLGVVGRDGP